MEWFRHDVNMENDSAIQILMLRHKLEGLGAYIHVVHLLYEGDGHVEKDRLLRNLRMYSSNADEIYQTLIDEGLLTEADGVVTSNRVVAEIEFDAEQRRKKSEAGRKGGLRSAEVRTGVQAQVKQRSSNAQATLKQNEAPNQTIPDQKEKNTTPTSSDVVVVRKESGTNGAQQQKMPVITLKDGSLFNVTEEYVELKQKAFPDLDAWSLFWQMDSRTREQPKDRPFVQSVDSYVTSWFRTEKRYLEEHSGHAAPSPERGGINNNREEYKAQMNAQGGFDL